MSRPPLLEHQRFAVDWLQHVNRGLLGDEPGLGKTRTAIEAYGGRDRVLVIAPALIRRRSPSGRTGPRSSPSPPTAG